jgi:hypothetical protein
MINAGATGKSAFAYQKYNRGGSLRWRESRTPDRARPRKPG